MTNCKPTKREKKLIHAIAVRANCIFPDFPISLFYSNIVLLHKNSNPLNLRNFLNGLSFLFIRDIKLIIYNFNKHSASMPDNIRLFYSINNKPWWKNDNFC